MDETPIDRLSLRRVLLISFVTLVATVAALVVVASGAPMMLLLMTPFVFGIGGVLVALCIHT